LAAGDTNSLELRRKPASTRLALFTGMKPVTRVAHQAADLIGRLFGRVAAVIVGFVMIVAGLGMTVTIVLLPAGIVTLLLGILILVGGIFAHADRRAA
jgi:hypothetical protein